MTAKSAIAIRGPLIRTLIFAVAGLLVLAIVAVQLGQFRFYSTRSFNADFTSASDLQGGDPVRLNGVEVGKVSDVSVGDNAIAHVSFSVKDSVRVPSDSKVAVRYRDLTGDRYLAVVPGSRKSQLARGSTIPLRDTRPALDLDVLLGGLKPLFTGLDPDQINTFSREIVAVLQGEGGNINAILEHVTSFGRTIADRDKVIGQTIDNLNSVLGNLDTHSAQLSSTVSNLQKVTTALNHERGRIGRSLVSVDRLTTSMADLVGQVRGPFRALVKQVARVSTHANQGKKTLNKILRILPGAYLRAGRVGSHGSGYGIYICALQVMIDGPNGKAVHLPWIGPSSHDKRCQRGVAPLETPEQRHARGEG